MSRSGAHCLASALVAALLSTAVGHADAILDQAQEDWYTQAEFSDTHWVAQTFTPSVGGQLDHVDLYTTWIGLSAPTATATIATTTGGYPDSPLGAATFDVGQGWTTASFLSDPVFLTAGTRYAIILQVESAGPLDTPYWGISALDDYGPGGFFENTVGYWREVLYSDAAFRTWMVPEPTAILLLGLTALLRRRW